MADPREPADAPHFRWQTLFQQTAEPLFLLSRRRRVLFVNRAFETLTGLTLAEIKGQACRRRPRGILAERTELILSALAPPPDALEGRETQARRALGGRTAVWQLAFFPFSTPEGPLAILGKITPLTQAGSAPAQPLSEKMLALRQRHADQFRLDQLVSETPAMVRVQEQMRLAATVRLPVLVTGPPGAGKRWIARAIHQLGPQREQTFACLDCGHLPPAAIADLLFAGAHGEPLGAVCLAHVAELPRDLQERLLSLLTGAESSVRIYATMSADPAAAVRAGQLLEELHCRLSTLVIQVPALNERMADFAWWCERLFRRASTAAQRQLGMPGPEALDLLRAHAWPGNLQELYEVLLGACLRAKGPALEAGDLPFHLRHGALPQEKPLNLDAILEEVERRLITQALKQASNNKSRAAELLTIWRARLLRRMETLGIKDQ